MKIETILKLNADISLPKQTVLNISYTQTLIAEKLSDVLKPYDISTEQFNVLRILRGQKDKPVNMGAIQERMIAKTSNTTRLVDKLLAKGLVDRAVCENNRRKIEVTITDKGLKLLNIVDKLVDNTEDTLCANLTDLEQRQLIELLEKIRK